MAEKLYRYYQYYGRMGSLSGIFAAEEAEVQAAIGKEVDFDEALGKHSHAYGPLEPHHGYNPLEYLSGE